MHSLMQDIRYSARVLLQRSGFSAIAVVTLAIGIGANTAMFSLINSILLKPTVGVSEPDQLIQVRFAGGALVLMLVGLLACYIPARRATKIEPLIALRHE